MQPKSLPSKRRESTVVSLPSLENYGPSKSDLKHSSSHPSGQLLSIVVGSKPDVHVAECDALRQCIVDLLVSGHRPPQQGQPASHPEIDNDAIQQDARLTKREVFSLLGGTKSSSATCSDEAPLKARRRLLTSDPWPDTEWKSSMMAMEIVSELFGGAMSGSSRNGEENSSTSTERPPREFVPMSSVATATEEVGTTFVSSHDGAVVHVWRSRSAARRFVFAFRDVAQAVHELLLPSCWTTIHTAALAYGGTVITVTWLPSTVGGLPLTLVDGSAGITVPEALQRVVHSGPSRGGLVCIRDEQRRLNYLLPTFKETMNKSNSLGHSLANGAISCALRCISSSFPQLDTTTADSAPPPTAQQQRTSAESMDHVRLVDEAALIQTVVMRLMSSSSLLPPPSCSDLPIDAEAAMPPAALRSLFWQAISSGKVEGGSNTKTRSSHGGGASAQQLHSFTISTIFHECGAPLSWLRRVRDTIAAATTTSAGRPPGVDATTTAPSNNNKMKLRRWYIAEVLGAEMVARTVKNIVSASCGQQFSLPPPEIGPTASAVAMPLTRRRSSVSVKTLASPQRSSPLQRKPSVSNLGTNKNNATPTTEPPEAPTVSAAEHRRVFYESKAAASLDVANHVLPLLFHNSDLLAGSASKRGGAAGANDVRSATAAFVKECLIPSLLAKYYHHHKQTADDCNPQRIRREVEECERLVQWWWSAPAPARSSQQSPQGIAGNTGEDVLARSITGASSSTREGSHIASTAVSNGAGPCMFILRHLTSRLGFHFNVAVHRFDRLSNREVLRSSGRSAVVKPGLLPRPPMYDVARVWATHRLHAVKAIQEPPTSSSSHGESRNHHVSAYLSLMGHWLLRFDGDDPFAKDIAAAAAGVLQHVTDPSTVRQLFPPASSAISPSNEDDDIHEQHRVMMKEEAARGYMSNRCGHVMSGFREAFASGLQRISTEDVRRKKEQDALLEISQLSARTQAAVPSDATIAAPRPPPSIFAQLLTKAGNAVIAANRLAAEMAQARPRLQLTKQRSVALSGEGKQVRSALPLRLSEAQDGDYDNEDDSNGLITHRPTLAGDVRRIHHSVSSGGAHLFVQNAASEGSSSLNGSPTSGASSPSGVAREANGPQGDNAGGGDLIGSPTASMASQQMFAESVLRNVVFDTEEDTIAARRDIIAEQEEEEKRRQQRRGGDVAPSEPPEEPPVPERRITDENQMCASREEQHEAAAGLETNAAVPHHDAPTLSDNASDALPPDDTCPLPMLLATDPCHHSASVESHNLRPAAATTQPPTPLAMSGLSPMDHTEGLSDPTSDTRMLGIDDEPEGPATQDVVANDATIVNAQSTYQDNLQTVDPTVNLLLAPTIDPPTASGEVPPQTDAENVERTHEAVEVGDDAPGLATNVDETDLGIHADNGGPAEVPLVEEVVGTDITIVKELSAPHVGEPVLLEPHDDDATAVGGALAETAVSNVNETPDTSAIQDAASCDLNEVAQSADAASSAPNNDAPQDADVSTGQVTQEAVPFENHSLEPPPPSEAIVADVSPVDVVVVTPDPPQPPQQADEIVVAPVPSTVEERAQQQLTELERDALVDEHKAELELDELFALFAPPPPRSSTDASREGTPLPVGAGAAPPPRSKSSKHVTRVPTFTLKDIVKKFKKIETDSRSRLASQEDLIITGPFWESYTWSWLQSQSAAWHSAYERQQADDEGAYASYAREWLDQATVAVVEASQRAHDEQECFDIHAAYCGVLEAFFEALEGLQHEELEAWNELMASNDSDKRTALGLARWRKKRVDAYYAARQADLIARSERERRDAEVDAAVAKARARLAKGVHPESNDRTLTQQPTSGAAEEEDALAWKRRKVLLAHLERRKQRELKLAPPHVSPPGRDQSSGDNGLHGTAVDSSGDVDARSVTSSLRQKRTHVVRVHQERVKAQDARRSRLAVPQAQVQTSAHDLEEEMQLVEFLAASLTKEQRSALPTQARAGIHRVPSPAPKITTPGASPGKLAPMFSPDDIKARLVEAEAAYESKALRSVGRRRQQDDKIAERSEARLQFRMASSPSPPPPPV